MPKEAAILSTNEATPPSEKNSSIVHSNLTFDLMEFTGLMVRVQLALIKNSSSLIS